MGDGKQLAFLTREMAEPEPILDAEFDAQLRGLFAQAEKAIESRPAVSPKKENSVASPPPTAAPQQAPLDLADRPAVSSPSLPSSAPSGENAGSRASQLSLLQLLKPLVLGLEAVSRATGENTGVLKKLETAADEATKAHKELPGVVSDLRIMLDTKNGISQSMFAALHEELQGYKDGFLLDSVHRPIIRDLISLYDDVSEIQRQVGVAIAAAVNASLCADGLELVGRLRTIEINIEHNLGFIIEVLNRLEVSLMPPHTGKLDKQTQRAVSVELAEDPDEDGMVVRAVKRGFLWKDRLFRAEEVIIRKWKEGFLVALAPSEPK